MVNKNVTIINSGDLIIDDSVYLAHQSTIICNHKITIGKKTIIGPNVVIVDGDHNYNQAHQLENKGDVAPIHIGNYVWIGANAVILKGVTLGDHCVVGAGAIVTKSFPEKSMIVGNPAKLLRTL